MAEITIIVDEISDETVVEETMVLRKRMVEFQEENLIELREIACVRL